VRADERRFIATWPAIPNRSLSDAALALIRN